jgi:hypothetical protein
MTDLSESNALAKPQADELSPEDLAQRRQGIAAATQMLVMIGRMSKRPLGRADVYDACCVEAEQLLATYLATLPSQPPAAQQGFIYSLADHLFSAYVDGGVLNEKAHEQGQFHANPALTQTQICDLAEAGTPDRHNGKALTPRERAALAQKWRAAFKRVNAGDTAIKRSNAGTAARRARKSPIEQGATQ